MLVERSVDGNNSEALNSNFARSKDMSLAEKFLGDHQTAKIVMIIDTHSADNGYFIWTGDTAESYRACSLLEVSNV